MRIILPKPRGFCAGVDYAIGIVEQALKTFSEPVYILKEIVHNRTIVEDLNQRGAPSVMSIEEVPAGSVIIFSAHGVPPEFHEQARQAGLKVIDATCPLVRKVHLEAIRYASKGYTILYIGHEGHDEALGVIAESPGSIILINDIAEAEKLDLVSSEKLVYLTQTTLSLTETAKIVDVLKARFPHLEEPPSEDICYATTNRQMAVLEMTKMVDLVLVIGSKNSSNSQRLRECAQDLGKPAYLIDNKEEIDLAWLEGVESLGLTAGASAPERLVRQVIAHLKELSPGATVEEIEFVAEKMYFPLPKLAV